MHFYREFSSGLISRRLRGFGPDAFLPRILERIGFQRASGIGPTCIFTENPRFQRGSRLWPRYIFTENSRADWCPKGFGVWAQIHFYREFSNGLNSRGCLSSHSLGVNFFENWRGSQKRRFRQQTRRFLGGPGDDAYIWFWGRFSRIQRKNPGVRPRCIFTDNSRAGWCLQGFADWAKMHF